MRLESNTMPIEPSQARYRSAHALQRLGNALGITLLPTDEYCVCLEKLASQAEFLKAITHDFESPTSREVILEEDLSERLAEELAGEREDEERHD